MHTSDRKTVVPPHRDLHAHFRSKDSVRTNTSNQVTTVSKAARTKHARTRSASNQVTTVSKAARTKRARTGSASNQVATVSKAARTKRARTKRLQTCLRSKNGDSAPVRLQTRLNPKRQLFCTRATTRVPQPVKAVIPHQCDFKPASARKGSYSASQRRIDRTQPSRPVVPSANVRIARRPVTPRPNTRFSRRRCAARNLALFSQPSRAHARLVLASVQRRG
jgi:hypothetical protein